MTATNKKYYWLKLPENFFKEKAIKKLKRLEHGYECIVIYQELLLLTMSNQGKYFYEGIEDTVAEEIALELDENAEYVAMTLEYLTKAGLIVATEKDIELTEVKNLVGYETEDAIRMRNARTKKEQKVNKNEQRSNKNEQCSNKNEQCSLDKEKDKEIDIKETNSNELVKKSETTTTTTKRFAKPTAEEVKAYSIELGVSNFDADHFVDYYESKGWKVGKVSMKDWKATVRNWLRQSKSESGRYAKREKPLPDYMEEQHEETPASKEILEKLQKSISELRGAS